jgi:hypothetical protein
MPSTFLCSSWIVSWRITPIYDVTALHKSNLRWTNHMVCHYVQLYRSNFGQNFRTNISDRPKLLGFSMSCCLILVLLSCSLTWVKHMGLYWCILFASLRQKNSITSGYHFSLSHAYISKMGSINWCNSWEYPSSSTCASSYLADGIWLHVKRRKRMIGEMLAWYYYSCMDASSGGRSVQYIASKVHCYPPSISCREPQQAKIYSDSCQNKMYSFLPTYLRRERETYGNMVWW